MNKAENTDENWSIDCSDPEIEAAFEDDGTGNFVPKDAKDAVEALKKVTAARAGQSVLSWTSKYGRRPPTPQSQMDTSSEDDEVIESGIDTSGFDFNDEASATRLQPRRLHGVAATPKGSAKKKTTSFENVLASVRRQKNIEYKEKRYKK